MDAKEIRKLLDETADRFAKQGRELFKDRQIFLAALGDTPETEAKFHAWICSHDVTTCPPEVIAWCQAQLNSRKS